MRANYRHLTLASGVFALIIGFGGLLGWRLWHFDTQPTRQEPLQCSTPAPHAAAPHLGMVWVPGGSFAMGDTRYPEEQPLRKEQVVGFWMDRTEVSNNDFAQFVQATGYRTVAERPVDTKAHPGLPPDMQQPGAVVFVMPTDANAGGRVTQWWRYLPGASWRHPGGPQTSIDGKGAFPVVAVAYEDAAAYAQWKGRSLPREAEWEWAARAARADSTPTVTANEQPKDANTWQGLFPVVNSGEDGFIGLAPVGCYQPNALGLHDMIGNVWEFTADRWTADHAAQAASDSAAQATADPSPPARSGAAPGQHVIKGGSFLCAPSYCMRYRAGARQPQDDDLAASHLGFRTVLRAAGP